MAREYRAFISYRHAEVDSRVAAEVQRSLERFHIPVAVRKETGIKSLAPIFRDKEELPVTAELSDDIGGALANSSHLIVICSPRLKESTWCQREIETFLKTHPVQDVLTVLAEGDPYDVIPEVLLKRPRQVTLEDGSTQEVLVAAEPLSCDFRSARKRDHRPELMRLAAAMLGVPYDSLARRQQRYRQRLATAAGMAAAAIIAYGAWSLVTIRNDYQQTLRNQSKTLARDALALQEEGNTYEALELALAALPGEGGDRPLVAQAELALQQVSRAYVPPTSNQMLLKARAADYGVARSFTLGHQVAGMQCTPDGSLLAAWSYSGDIACWDVPSGRCLYQASYDRYAISGVHLLDDRRLVLLTDYEEVSCIDLDSGQELWHQRSHWGDYEEEAFAEDEDARDEGLEFFVVDSCVDEVGDRLVIQDSSNEEGLLLLDLKDGSEAGYLSLEDVVGDRGWTVSSPLSVAEGSCALPWGAETYDTRTVVLADLRAATLCQSKETFKRIDNLQALPGGMVLVSSLASTDGVTAMQEWGTSDGWVVLSSYAERLSCVDVASGKTVWATDLPLWQPLGAVSAFLAPLDPGDGTPRDMVVWCGANVCAWLDPQTGELLGHVETPSSFVGAWLRERMTTSDTSSHLSDNIEGCLADGSYVLCRLDTSLSLAQKCYPSDVTLAQDSVVGEFVASGDTVLLYGLGQADDAWQLVDDTWYDTDRLLETPYGLAAFDPYPAEETGAATVSLFDLENASQIWETALWSDAPEARVAFVGSMADDSSLVFSNERSDGDGIEVAIVQLEDGAVRYLPLTGVVPDGGTGEALGGDAVTLAGSTLVSIVCTQDWDHLLCATDLNTMVSTLYGETSISGQKGVGSASGWVLMPCDYAESAEDSSTGYLCRACNVGTGETWEPDEAVVAGLSNLGGLDAVDAFWGEGDMLYLHAPREVVAYQSNGTRRFSISLGEDYLTGMGLFDGDLWLALWEGDRLMLRWYDPQSGELRGECVPDVALDPDERNLLVEWLDIAVPARGEEGLSVLILGCDAAVIDRAGAVYQLVEGCSGYNQSSDCFLVDSSDISVSGFGTYHRYTLEGLISRAQDLLGDTRMSEQRRQEFGL